MCQPLPTPVRTNGHRFPHKINPIYGDHLRADPEGFRAFLIEKLREHRGSVVPMGTALSIGTTSLWYFFRKVSPPITAEVIAGIRKEERFRFRLPKWEPRHTSPHHESRNSDEHPEEAP
jgi:hypothetical protein